MPAVNSAGGRLLPSTTTYDFSNAGQQPSSSYLPVRFWQVSDCSLRAVNHLSVWLPGLTHWLFLCGHFRASIYQGGTMSDVTIPGGKIRAFVERIENLDTEML